VAEFSSDVAEDGQQCVLTLVGDVDLGVGDQLIETAIGSATETDASCLVIDFAAVTSIDSAGLDALDRIRHAVNGIGKYVVLWNVSGPIRELLATSALDRVFPVYRLATKR
jgi:anti-anti-sigma factor